MDQWTELADEADRDDQAAADAAEGERLRVALAKPRWADLLGIDPAFTGDSPAAECAASARLVAVMRLHMPVPVPDPEWQGADWCNECGHGYPCPTTRAAMGEESL